MLNDPLSNTMSAIMNAEKAGKPKLEVRPVSKLIKSVLELLQKSSYIGSYREAADGRGGSIEIILSGTINKCGAVKPRSSINKKNYELFEKRYLPAKDFGILIISTPKGVLSHAEAKKLSLGGRLIAYCY